MATLPTARLKIGDNFLPLEDSEARELAGRKADEFTEWLAGSGAPSDLKGQPYLDGTWVWDRTSGGRYTTSATDPSAIELNFGSFAASRSRVLYTGDRSLGQMTDLGGGRYEYDGVFCQLVDIGGGRFEYTGAIA